MGEKDGYQQALVKAYDMLARRDCMTGEIRQKLLKSGADEDDVERVLETLRTRRYIDDARVARESVVVLSSRKGWGREKIRRWLHQRGVDGDLANQALAELPPEVEAAQAGLLASQQKARGKSPQQVYRFLVSRGFRTEVARDAALGDDEPS